MSRKTGNTEVKSLFGEEYGDLVGGIRELLDASRRAAVRTVNTVMTATYWEIGRRIVEFEQHGEARAGYGEKLLKRLSEDLTTRFGRGFSRHNLARFRDVYLVFPPEKIRATVSLKSFEEAAGIIHCSSKGKVLVRYATEGLPNKMLVCEYLTTLPDEKLLATEIDKTRKRLGGLRG